MEFNFKPMKPEAVLLSLWIFILKLFASWLGNFATHVDMSEFDKNILNIGVFQNGFLWHLGCIVF